jgi:LysM repeat protein
MAQTIKFEYELDRSATRPLTDSWKESKSNSRVRILVKVEGAETDRVDWSPDMDFIRREVDEQGNEDFFIEDGGDSVITSDLKSLQSMFERAGIRAAIMLGRTVGFEGPDGQNYVDGDPYPKEADPNQEGEDPTPANAPTEDEEEGGIIEPVEAIEPIAGITPIDAGLLPTTQPTLAPLRQGVGLNDAVAPDDVATANTDRPEEKVIDNNAFNYTGSPLGLIISNSAAEFSKRNFIINQGNSAEGGKTLSPNPLNTDLAASELHQDSVYDISTNNIIDKLSAYPSLALKWADFAYCRDFGVYPNNRLVVCRRFSSPQTDDLTFVKDSSGPISTIVTWIDDTANLLEFSFGEEWTDAGVSFIELLNEVGDDMGMKFAKLGDIFARAVNLVPMPGATELLQRRILEKLGVIGDSTTSEMIPSGTPNLIKESRQRKLIKEDSPGSGLVGKFNIKVKCAWEQKFISGVDPTLIYYEILHTILSFGGSQAVFYLGKKSNLGGLGKLLDRFSKPGGVIDVIKEVMNAFKDEIVAVADKITKAIKELFNGENPPKDAEVDQNDADAVKQAEEDAKAADQEAEKQRQKTLNDAVGQVESIVTSFVETIVKKYRVRALGIVTSLTGLPSTPWHVTIGNPLRPILSSGDMECSNVSVNLGPQLSFNDLPSYIECEFTLTSARNLGIDEIMSKLNCGSIRISDEAPSFWNFYDDKPKTVPEQPATQSATQSTTADVANTEGPSGPLSNEVLDALPNVEGQGVLTPEAAIEIAAQSKVGNEITTNGVSLNPDPNSAEVLLGKVEPPLGDEYTVKAGDSISKIAKNKLGPNASQSEILAETKRIIALNNNKNPLEVDGIVNTNSQSDPDFIRPGDKLFI